MKKITWLTLLIICFIDFSRAQDQTQQLTNIQKGNYLSYLTTRNSSGKYEGGLRDLTYRITSIKDYRIFPEHKEVYMIRGGDPDRPDKDKELMFLPDNEAYPITYIEKVFEGNKSMQEELGFAPRINPYTDGNRLVFLDQKIYMIENWKDKDNYTLLAVLEYQPKKVSKFKLMKETMKSPKKMNALQPHEKLQQYLDTAFKKQKEHYATWIKKAENANKVAHTKSVLDLTLKAIKKKNEDWRNSAEYKRIKERNQMAKSHAQNSYAIVINQTGQDIYLYAEGSNNGSVIRNGSSVSTIDCTKNQYYTFSAGMSSREGTKIITANQSCGLQVIVK
ncbi:hypothetical protein HN014_15990 [Aquimarina sp. TRL1]|uniref:hypothetical protein n=1 Tax=Aquimarina sp. (strain TRL1) TaxID=2736252 RepID=UPI00158C78C8|nr:hypothetical protein [Aquimarina sp. TRL1]QKX06349.1 hypothetical protein HN014_15990 [Aquimarina sp. TRL1]